MSDHLSAIHKGDRKHCWLFIIYFLSSKTMDQKYTVTFNIHRPLPGRVYIQCEKLPPFLQNIAQYFHALVLFLGVVNCYPEQEKANGGSWMKTDLLECKLRFKDISSVT